jgi:kynureninase
MSSAADAAARDAADPGRRDAFLIPAPAGSPGGEWAYFAGNSLGLQPKAARAAVETELEAWARLGVEAWLEAPDPWLTAADAVREPLGRVVGAAPAEVVVMHSLTVNLHLLMASFYRPSGERTRIVIEDSVFPSDGYAVAAQAAHHGLDPEATVLRLRPRDGETALRTADVVEAIERDAPRIALVLLGGVNYLSGEVVDMAAVAAAGRRAGAVVGLDLAHAAGNVPLALHDWDVDFAVWCHYKYLNGGPGAPGGAFVHARHAAVPPLGRLAGWWGNDPAARFRMERGFTPRAGAAGWQVSTPAVLAHAPVHAALRQFDEVGIAALRARSERLTGHLEALLGDVARERALTQITPREPERRGCQLSVRVPDAAGSARRLRAEHGVVCDVREPDVLRFAPVPLYSTYDDCRRAAAGLAAVLPPRA